MKPISVSDSREHYKAIEQAYEEYNKKDDRAGFFLYVKQKNPLINRQKLNEFWRHLKPKQKFTKPMTVEKN